MNEKESTTPESACGDTTPDWGSDTSDLAPEQATGLDDLSSAASDRIRRFMAESTFRGGASPGDVANLYTSQEVMDDDAATAYLDRRFVHGEVPNDWRELQDRLSTAHYDGPPAASSDALLDRIRTADQRAARGSRSIFDDPEDDELEDDELGNLRMEDRDPNLSDLGQEARAWIERYIVSEILCYGIAPFKVMQLREQLRVLDDDRALQYLDLPFELGDRPADWDGLRDRALMTRARLESLGVDPADAYRQADGAHPDASATDLLAWIEDQATNR